MDGGFRTAHFGRGNLEKDSWPRRKRGCRLQFARNPENGCRTSCFGTDSFFSFRKPSSPAAISYPQTPPVDSGSSREIHAVAENTPHRDDLQAAMNAALPAEQFENVINKDTTLYKLSWRETYSELTADGKPSIYNRFLNLKNFEDDT